MFKIQGFEPRLYQQTILQTCSLKNTLVILPTGLGKTKLAIMAAIERMNNHPNSKVLFLTVTKPLADQICKEFKECTNFNENEIVLFTGEVQPQKRKQIFKDAKIIVSTPQTAANDVINNRMNMRNVCLLIADECHAAIGNYDYVFLAKQYNNLAKYPRIIGLTASPGANKEKITEVCNNLFIEDVEVKTYDDPEVKPYVQETKIDYVYVELPEEFKKVKKDLDTCLKSKLNLIQTMGFSKQQSFTSKKSLLELQKNLQHRISSGEKDSLLWTSISLVAEAMKVQHAQTLLETQGLRSVYMYMKKLYSDANKTKVKATKNLVADINFKTAYFKICQLVENNSKDPKISKLKKIVEQEIKHKKQIKIIIFNQFRDCAQEIVKQLNYIDNVDCRVFIGQMKKNGLGMTQKEQIQILNKFKEGEFNTICMTSVGEQGLDIPSVDLVIFYEPVPSAIRSIQRRGRTGRHDKGRIKVLITKGTMDEAYRWSAHHKEKKMYDALKDIKNVLKFKKENATLDKFQEKNDVKVYADSREMGSNVIKNLYDLGLEVKSQNLDIGDFVVDEEIVIERKTKEDFVNSIIDKRILTQLISMKKNYKKPILIIEGNEDIYSVRNIHPNAIRGMLSAIAIDFGIPIIYSKDMKDTAEIIHTIAKREQNKDAKDFGVRLDKKPLSTKEQQEFIIESLPGIGPSLAKSLLKEFTTVTNVINAEKERLIKVDKIGMKKAEEIQRVLNAEYWHT